MMLNMKRNVEWELGGGESSLETSNFKTGMQAKRYKTHWPENSKITNLDKTEQNFRPKIGF